MLAHLALPCSSLTLSRSLARSLIYTGFAALVSLASRTATAADLTPPGTYDARTTGKVMDGTIGRKGTMTSALRVDGAESSVKGEDLGLDAEHERGALGDAHRASVFFGASLNGQLEVSLGLHGTYEHADPAVRDSLFPEEPAADDLEDDTTQGWRGNVRQAGFAGASLMLKYKAIDWRSLRLGLAPFVESGAGESATYALTRSASPRAGFALIAAYGTKGVADFAVNSGLRYRDPELVGELILRHETFTRGMVRAWLNRDTALYVSAEGRSIQVAHDRDRNPDNGRPVYQFRHAGEATLGAQYDSDSIAVSLYGGRQFAAAGSSFGYGTSVFGVALSMPVGNYRGVRSRPSFADDVKKYPAPAEKKPEATAAIPEQTPAAPEYPEMIGADIDPLEAIEDKQAADDFSNVDHRMKENSRTASESEDARIERELAELREAEKKAEAERARIEAADREADRKARVRKAAEDEELMREWQQEAEQEAAGLDGITEDEVNWNGLDQ